MGIIVDSILPAFEALRSEGLPIAATGERLPDATIGLINLMPIKPETEKDFMRLLAPGDGWFDFRLIRMASHRKSKNTSEEHLNRFYTTFEELDRLPDGVIVTGAPLEGVDFEDVDYWQEITAIFNQLREHRIPTLYVCWGAFAVVYHWWGIPMRIIDRKISGVFPSRITKPGSPIIQGIADGFQIPVSRYAVWNDEDISKAEGLDTVAEGDEQGKFLLETDGRPEWFITGHGEYGRLTLNNEYFRDLGRGLNPHIPDNYYPDNDPSATPAETWRHSSDRMATNWLNIVINHKQKNHD